MFEGLGKSLEAREKLPLVETVRGAIFYHGKFLLLQKSKDSKSPGSLEFPGGKIDKALDKKDADSNEEEQEEALNKEVSEETGLDIKNLKKEKIETFKTYFEATAKDGQKKQFRRMVHLFLIHIEDTEEVSLTVGETLNHTGEPEDNHSTHIWLSPEELIKATIFNKDKSEDNHSLLRNSRHIRKLLEKLKK